MEYRDKDWFVQALERHGNINNVAKQTGYAKTTLRRYAKKFEIEHLSDPKKHYDKKEGVLYNDENWLKEQLKLHGSGKRIAEVNQIAVTSVNRWLRRYGLQDDRNVGQNSRVHSLDEHFFETIDSEEKAYWLGLIVADGCITHFKTSYNLAFTIGLIDKEHIEKLRTSLNNTNEIYETVGTKGNIDVHYSVSSKKLFKDLEKLGVVQRKTGKEVLPDIPRELIRHFIRGYFDGDGSTSGFKDYNLIGFNICCANKEFLENVKRFLEEELSIQLNPVRSNGINNYFLDLKNREKCYYVYSYLYTNCQFYLDRKHKTISKFLSEYSPPAE